MSKLVEVCQKVYGGELPLSVIRYSEKLVNSKFVVDYFHNNYNYNLIYFDGEYQDGKYIMQEVIYRLNSPDVVLFVCFGWDGDEFRCTELKFVFSVENKLDVDMKVLNFMKEQKMWLDRQNKIH